MQIYVCVKHVPDTAANIYLTGKTAYDESVKFVANPYDEYGLEEAIKAVKENGGGEVVIVTVGPEGAISTIRSALAVGADRGILITTDDQFTDSMKISQALKKAIEQDGSPDLIFTGKQTVDSEGMQTHYHLAAAFDMPIATDVVDFKLSNGKIVVEREIEGGARQIIEMTKPCVIGATKGLNEPRYPKLPDILKAKKKEIKKIAIADLEILVSDSGTQLLELQPAPEKGAAKMIEGDAHKMAEELIQLLKNEAKVI